jgi:S1-C subfamily serine protease
MRFMRRFLIAAIASIAAGCAATPLPNGGIDAVRLAARDASDAAHAPLRCLARSEAATLALEIFLPNPILPEQDPAAAAADPDRRTPGLGSGTAVSADGHVLTAAHLLDNDGLPTAIRVVRPDPATGRPAAHVAHVVMVDEAHDVAVIKFDLRFEHVAPIGDDDDVRPGDDVYGVGFPFAVGRLVVRGYVMGTRNAVIPGLEGRLVLDLRSGPGASGGGLYAASTGAYVGTYQGTHAYRLDTMPPLYDFIRYGANVRDVRALLDAAGVKYLDAADAACGP